MYKNIAVKLLLAISTTLTLTCFNANALSFKLTETEFNYWDMRCKACDVMTGFGMSSGFKRHVPQIEHDQ